MNKRIGIRHVYVAGVLALVVLTGCQKKRPSVPPSAAEAPAITIPSPFPPEPAVAETTTTAPPAASQPVEAQPEEAPSSTKPKPKHSNHSNKNSKEGNTEVASKTPGKVVVEEGGVSEAPAQAISAGMDQNQAAQQRQVTEQLLQSTDSNLKALNRTLNSDEKAMVEQIKSYVTQSRAAINDGDLVRANNLALKAHLLSDALVKH
jgi:hypothetical protein